MSVQLMESLTSIGFGAADAVIAAKVTRKLPGGIPASAYFEGAGILFGMFGQKLGFGADTRDPVMISSLALAGARGAKLAMAGKLFQPAQWGSVGGDSVLYGSEGFSGLNGGVGGRNWAPGIRRIGRGGLGLDLSPVRQEIGGIAG